MKYFLVGEDRYIIDKQVKKIISKIQEKNNDYEVVSFSFLDISLNDLISTIKTISLFGNKRIFVISDALFVTEEKVKYSDDFDKEKLEKIIDFATKDTIIFTCLTQKISERLKITKKIKEVYKFMRLESPSEKQKKEKFIEKLKNANIEFVEEDIDYFLTKIPSNDMTIYINETKRLIDLNKKITKELIDDVLTRYVVFNFFEMLDAFVSNNVSMFLKSYSGYISSNETAFGFLTTASKNLSLLKNVLFLKQQNKSSWEISEFLKENPYRIKTLEKNNKSTLEQVNKKLKIINDMIIKCSLGAYDQKIIPEYELIKLMIDK